MAARGFGMDGGEAAPGRSGTEPKQAAGRPPKVGELIGKRFGRLVVEARPSRAGKGRVRCRCDCGGEKTVRAHSLTIGETRSCGCLYRETRRTALRHGGKRSRLYGIWKGMRERCAKETDGLYGGRGLRVAPEWERFEAFRDWALANGYAPDLSIDRRDNDAGYSGSNCRWATSREQARNKRSNRAVVRSDGETFGTIVEAAEDAGVSKSTLRSALTGRIRTAGGFTWRYADGASGAQEPAS